MVSNIEGGHYQHQPLYVHIAHHQKIDEVPEQGDDHGEEQDRHPFAAHQGCHGVSSSACRLSIQYPIILTLTRVSIEMYNRTF